VTTYVAAQPVKPAKPAKARNTAKAAKTSTAKSTAKAKSARASAKHTQPDAHQKHVLHEEHLAHLRGWARSSDVLPACAAEAVAMSLRLAGQRVTPDEVAGLHWAAGGDAVRPASVAGVLAAVARSGLAGCRPVLPVQLLDEPSLPCGQWPHVQHVDLREVDDRFGEGLLHGLAVPALAVAAHGTDQALGGCLPDGRDDATDEDEHQYLWPADRDVNVQHALILGVDAPGPHCVLATADGWWSWGRLYRPWSCRIECRAAVTWT